MNENEEMEIEKMKVFLETKNGKTIQIDFDENEEGNEEGTMGGHPLAYVCLLNQIQTLGFDFIKGAKDEETKEIILKSMELINREILEEVERSLNE